MNGQVLDFSVQTNSGVISGDDGSRYNFIGSEWKETVNPSRGMRVDFEAQGDNAVSIYRVVGASTPGGSISDAFSGEKNKLVAGLLGIFLGWMGAHKFYLGFSRPGTPTSSNWRRRFLGYDSLLRHLDTHRICRRCLRCGSVFGSSGHNWLAGYGGNGSGRSYRRHHVSNQVR